MLPPPSYAPRPLPRSLFPRTPLFFWKEEKDDAQSDGVAISTRDFNATRDRSTPLSEENRRLAASLSATTRTLFINEQKLHQTSQLLMNENAVRIALEREVKTLRESRERLFEALSAGNKAHKGFEKVTEEVKTLQLELTRSLQQTNVLRHERDELAAWKVNAIPRLTALEEEIRSWETLVSAGDHRITELENKCQMLMSGRGTAAQRVHARGSERDLGTRSIPPNIDWEVLPAIGDVGNDMTCDIEAPHRLSSTTVPITGATVNLATLSRPTANLRTINGSTVHISASPGSPPTSGYVSPPALNETRLLHHKNVLFVVNLLLPDQKVRLKVLEDDTKEEFERRLALICDKLELGSWEYGEVRVCLVGSFAPLFHTLTTLRFIKVLRAVMSAKTVDS
ncbi:hypothetical protein HDU93_002219 [Gonapodya sp. JEL0774]|nr:hypothetical protein HDU93_002219 [Gonapodya sp. JEL0774]